MPNLKPVNLKIASLMLSFLVLTGCNSIKHGKSPNVSDDDTKVFHAVYSSVDSKQGSNYVCDDFVSNALSNYTIAKINKNFSRNLKCTKKPIKNTHNSAVTDTMYTFSNRNNTIQLYRAEQHDFIVIFDVKDSKFKLKGNIKTGMSKDNFSRKFQITKTLKNKVQIASSDGSMEMIFYFEKNILKRINCHVYLD